jgi:hypothetical protein
MPVSNPARSDSMENIQLGAYLHVERIPFGRLARAATQDFAASTMTLKVPPHKRHDRHAKSIMKSTGGEQVNGPKVSSLIRVLHCHIIGTREGPGTFITSPELTNYVCVFASAEDWTRQIKQVRVPPALHNNGCVISRAKDTSAAKYEDHPSLVTHPRRAPNKRAADVEMRFGHWPRPKSIKIRLWVHVGRLWYADTSAGVPFIESCTCSDWGVRRQSRRGRCGCATEEE